jgi:predicted SnoaL-like aldol condensation-catalyzing enzyme
MAKELEEKNKALVLRAFDTLFNKCDYEAAGRFWSPQYIQHSAHIASGREGLFDLIRSIPQHSNKKRESSWAKVISSSYTDDSVTSAPLRIGLPQIL